MIYEYNGKRYELDDNTKPEDAYKLIQQANGETTPDAAPAAPQAELPQTKGVTSAADLVNDPDFVSSAAIMWSKANPGKEYTGTKAEMVDWYVQSLAAFNYNTVAMGIDAADIAKASTDEKRAFLYGLNAYDDLGISVDGTGRFLKYTAIDPLTYVGLGTLGLGFAAKKGAAVVGKEGVKALLKEGLKLGTQTAIESGVLSAGQSYIQQQARVNADGQEAIDYGQVAGAGVAGAAVGGIAGTALGAVGARLGSRAGAKAGEVAAEDASKVAPNVDSPSLTQGESQAADSLSRVSETPKIETPADGAPSGSAEAPAVEAPAPKLDAPTLDPATGATENPILQAVREIAQDSGLRTFPRTAEELSKAAEGPIAKILALSPDEAKPLIEEVRRALLTGEQGLILKGSVAKATDKLLREVADLTKQKAGATGEELTKLEAQQHDLHKLVDVVKSLDVDASSITGHELGARVGMLNTNEFRQVSPDAILTQKGIDPALATKEQRAQAQDEFGTLVIQRIAQAEADNRVKALTDQIEAALTKGDFTQVETLMKQRTDLKSAIVEGADGQKGYVGKTVDLLNEVAISNVFSPKTVVVNILPTMLKLFYRPGLDALARGPFDSISYRMAAAQYAAYATHFNAALRASVAAFRYERGLLTGDFSKILEGKNIIPKQYGGGIVRIFPRLLTASDELFSQLLYRSFITSEATGQAFALAAEKGLKGKAADDFVKKAVEAAVERSYSNKIDISTIDMLRAEGISRGYKDSQLYTWIKMELQKNGELFRKAESEAGRNYANDALFKREFSGEGFLSNSAKSYESWTNRYPLVRLLGQLFFRTPVRVLEEGMRLTPGVNFVSGLFGGSFLNDLKGLNGPINQARAQGEAMLSMAIGTGIMSLYARGDSSITGAGPSDAKTRKQWTQAGHKPYTMKIGSWEWEYRNYDPIATPIKIIANTVERIQELNYRSLQGEFDNKGDFDVAAYYVLAAGYGIMTALKDANLVTGVSSIADLVSDASDIENGMDGFMKFLADKARLMVPSTVTKMQEQLFPGLTDARTIEQVIRSRINPADSLVPKRYDTLGNVMTDSNPTANLTGIELQRQKQGEKTKGDRVNEELAKLAFNNDTNFQLQARNKYVPALAGQDLRTVTTEDGKTTVYDRLNEEIRTTRIGGKTLEEALYDTLVAGNAGPYGTPSTPGMREDIVRAILDAYRTVAGQAVERREVEAAAKTRLSQQDKLGVKMGRRDRPELMPYQ